jgi:hypothetical protein
MIGPNGCPPIRVIGWFRPRFSYADAAPLLENLATAIQNAKKIS